jgi:uncharacterized protein YjbI with pentapeptide repeats
MNNLILKPLLLFFIGVLGIYILIFTLCLYVHVKESNIIANRADDLLGKLTQTNKSNWRKIANIQNMVRKTKPTFWELLKADNSLFGKREFYEIINRKLAKKIENNKNHLGGLILGQVHLEGTDFTGADMHGVFLEKANLSGADLRGANLIGAKLNKANLSHANLKNAKLLDTDLSDAILKGADFRNVIGLHCGQILSALIDENTQFPAYILLKESSDKEFNCKNVHQTNGGWDLSKINLSNADLPYAQFNNTNLNEANLNGANLFTAEFNKASIQDTDLRGAKLNGAKGLTCKQIKTAVLDDKTSLPDYISLTGSQEAGYICVEIQ